MPAKPKPRRIYGMEHRLGGGRRAWRSVLHFPTANYKSFRVVFKAELEDGTWDWTSRNPDPNTEEGGRALLQQVDEALLTMRPAPARSRVKSERTMTALGELYLADNRRRKLAVRTVEGRESQLRAHIVPAVGALPVGKWRLEHTNLILGRAGATCGPARLQDIRSTLSAMRKLAWREGWLDRSVDPLDGAEVKSGKQRLHGAGEHYVAPEERPALHMLCAMADAADQLSVSGSGVEEPVRRLPLFGTKIRIAGYAGLRLGEQNALRPIDVYFESNRVFVNGSWTHPRQQDQACFRGPVKNKVLHWAPVPASVLRELLPRCAQLLGLPEDATMQQIINAQRKERARREKEARRLNDPEVGWYNLPVAPEDEAWLFIDTATGLPVTGHEHNSSWHKVRRWVDRHNPEHSWPDFIVYRNLRHHAATWWHEELGREWVDVAAWLGDKLTTVLEHYVLSGQGALDEASVQMQKY